MKITNKTSVTIFVMGSEMAPGQSSQFTEMAFNRLSIHSEIGSCEIFTEYSFRSFESYGRLIAKEGRGLDANGLKEIIITEKKE